MGNSLKLLFKFDSKSILRLCRQLKNRQKKEEKESGKRYEEEKALLCFKTQHPVFFSPQRHI